MTLPLTGERTVPGIAEENYWFRRHEAAYLHLIGHCADAVVLEAGCGEGYGAQLIRTVARRVIALDYDELTSQHVARQYPQLNVLRGNLATLPLRDESADVVANLQVIEHLWDQEGFLAECRRVLKPGGKLIVTTPNRLTFSPGQDTPLNPFHTRELAPSELDEMLKEAGFRVDELTGLRHGKRLDSLLDGQIISAQVEVALSGAPWPAELKEAVESVTVEDFDITPQDMDTCLDLVAVAVRA